MGCESMGCEYHLLGTPNGDRPHHPIGSHRFRQGVSRCRASHGDRRPRMPSASRAQWGALWSSARVTTWRSAKGILSAPPQCTTSTYLNSAPPSSSKWPRFECMCINQQTAKIWMQYWPTKRWLPTTWKLFLGSFYQGEPIFVHVNSFIKRPHWHSQPVGTAESRCDTEFSGCQRHCQPTKIESGLSDSSQRWQIATIGASLP